MTDRYLSTVYSVVSHVTGVPMSDLTPQSRFSEFVEFVEDEDELEYVYEQCCEILGVPLSGILNSMPDYRQKVGDLTLNSWRNIAPFNTGAMTLLERHDVKYHDETLAGLAESMRQGVYVSSGEVCPSRNPPRSVRYVVGWAVGLPVAAVAIPYGLTLLPCNPICTDCTQSTWSQMTEVLPISMGVAVLHYMIAFVPGLIGMRNGRHDKPTLAELRAHDSGQVSD